MTTSPSAGDACSLTGSDSFWLRMDSPVNLMIINGVMVFGEPVEYERVHRVLEERLASIERFRSVVELPAGRGRPTWRPDPVFDMNRHLVRHRLEEPAGEKELRDFVSARMGETLDPDHPLWRFTLIENYQGGAALFGRLHHCLGDGIAMMMILLSLTDRTREQADAHSSPFRVMFDGASKEVFQRAKREVEEIMPEGMRLLQRPAQAFKEISAAAKGAASTASLAKLTFCSRDRPGPFGGELGVEKRVAWSRSYPVERLKGIKQALGGTLNDIASSATAGGLRRYLLTRGANPDKIHFRATVPVNMRPLEGMADLGNEFGLVYLPIPVSIEDPTERLAEVGRCMKKLKRSAEALVTLRVLSLLGRTPKGLQRQAVKLFASKATAVMTNVPGPRERLFLGGHPIEDLFFWVPQSGQLSMGISLLSYAGSLRLGVSTDAGLVPDPERIVEGFEAEMDEMLARAELGKTRPPGTAAPA